MQFALNRPTFLVVTTLILLTPLLADSQSVTITPKKVIYKRSGRDVDDYKQEFEVRYPIFTGKLSANTLKKLKYNTDYWRLFEMSLSENLKDDTWLSRLDYQVKYNKNYLLSIWLTAEGAGAYPDSSTKYVVLDLKTGNDLQIEDLFNKTQLSDLRNLIRRKMRAAENGLGKDEKAMLKDIRQEEPDRHPSPEKIELKDLDGFTVTDRGVTFIYSYGYPHVAKALEHLGEFFIPYSQLKPVILRDGLLARFIR